VGSVAVSHEAVQTAASLSASTQRKSALRRKLHAARVAARHYRQRLQSLRRSADLRRSDKRPHRENQCRLVMRHILSLFVGYIFVDT